LGIKYKLIHIERGKKILLNRLPKDKLAGGNFSARLRMTLLYYHAAINNFLVLGTADKSELMFGDAGADILPIGELYESCETFGKRTAIARADCPTAKQS
jgi:NAD+ synthase